MKISWKKRFEITNWLFRGENMQCNMYGYENNTPKIVAELALLKREQHPSYAALQFVYDQEKNGKRQFLRNLTYILVGLTFLFFVMVSQMVIIGFLLVATIMVIMLRMPKPTEKIPEIDSRLGSFDCDAECTGPYVAMLSDYQEKSQEKERYDKEVLRATSAKTSSKIKISFVLFFIAIFVWDVSPLPGGLETVVGFILIATAVIIPLIFLWELYQKHKGRPKKEPV